MLLERLKSSDKLKVWASKLNLTIDEVNELVSSSASIKRCNTIDDLPSIGNANILYIITDSYSAYVWNPDTIQYVQINKIKQIICGDSNV